MYQIWVAIGRELASDNDVAVGTFLAGDVMRFYYNPDFLVVLSLEDLRKQEAKGRRVWVVTTLERVLANAYPDVLAHLRQNYELVQVLPGSLDDGDMRIYMREAVVPTSTSVRPPDMTSSQLLNMGTSTVSAG